MKRVRDDAAYQATYPGGKPSRRENEAAMTERTVWTPKAEPGVVVQYPMGGTWERLRSIPSCATHDNVPMRTIRTADDRQACWYAWWMDATGYSHFPPIEPCVSVEGRVWEVIDE